MNLYIRFFNDETLVTNVDDAMSFLTHVTNGQIEPSIYNELVEYANSSMPYPRRFKVRTRVYFIVIKTPALTMEEFKARGQQMQAASAEKEIQQETTGAQEQDIETPIGSTAMASIGSKSYDTPCPGWYDAEILFKRVLFNESKGKNEYVDTLFAARLKAHNVRECYELVCSHLMNREDVDNRSQMPSIKGRNFRYKYLGMSI